MSAYDGSAPAAPPPEPCAACREPATCEVWSQPLCVECTGAWRAESGLDSGGVDPASKLSHVEMCAEYRRRTTAWLPRRRVELAKRRNTYPVAPEQSQ